MLASLMTAQAAPEDQPLGVLGDGGTWKFNNGAEFPGATGEIVFRVIDGRSTGVISYDFTEGGRYVAVFTKVELGADVTEIRFQVNSVQAERIAVRLRDSSGQYHQFALPYSTPGEWQTLRQPVAGVSSPIHFHGNNDGVIQFPVTEFWILIEKPSRTTKGNGVFFADVKALR